MGGYRTQGKTPSERDVLMNSAKAVERAGAFCVVLECVEETLAKEITEALSIPTIGIGSGNSCDGQILVLHDLLGLTEGHAPKFVRPTGAFRGPIIESIKAYANRTREGV